MTHLRVACIGAGYFSQFHYESWARMARVVLVGACDLDIEKARATGLPEYGDLGQMLTQTAPDLLDIILPPDAQAGAIRTAIDAGLKTIICQKSFCRDIHEAQQMTEPAHENGVRIIIHENFRFQPWYRHLKTALEEGAVGTLHQITFRLRPGDGQGPDAYLDHHPYFQTMPRFLVHETAGHWIDTFRYLLGNPLAVYADLRRINPAIIGEDAGYILFDHPSGVRELFDANRSLDHPATNHRRTKSEALIEGTKAMINLRSDGALWRRAFHTEHEVCIKSADTGSSFGGDCVHALQAHLITGVLDGMPLENLAQDYLTVIDIENAIYHLSATGRKITLATK